MASEKKPEKRAAAGGKAAPARNKTLLERPETREVRIGGARYRVGEIRPCDVGPLGDFIEGMSSGPGPAALAEWWRGEARPGGPAALAAFGRERSESACRLLAALFDPDPLAPDDGSREATARRLSAAPMSEVTAAVGAWMELNRPFLGRILAPLILGSVSVLTEVNRLIDERLSESAPTPSTVGNA